MNTVLIWLLVSVGSSRTPTQVVERFATVEDCEVVAKAAREGKAWGYGEAQLQCIKARVARP